MAEIRDESAPGVNGDTMVEEKTVRRVRRQIADPEILDRINEVPHEPRPFSGTAPRAGLEGGIVFFFFAIAYGLIGYFLLTDARIVNFISLAHLNEAFMVAWNDPPRLAALGLDAAALVSVLYIPLSIVKPLATSLVAMPVLTAVAAGFLMASLNNLMRNCDIALAFRIILLVLFGLNPMFVYYAANGDPTVIGVFLLAIALSSLISWSISSQTRHLAAAGLAIALAVMVDYGYGLVAVGITLALMFVAGRKRDEGVDPRATLLLFLTPVAYALLFWCLINWVLLGNPIEWISAQNGVIQVNTTGALQAVGADFGGSMGDLFEVTLGVAPLAMVAGVLLVLTGIVRGDSTSWGMLAVGITIAAVPVLRAVVADQANLLDLSYGIPLAVFAVAAVACAGRDGWSAIAAVVMGVGLIAAIPLGWNAMQDYQYQNQAQAFTRWVDTQDTQEGTSSRGDYSVGIDPELAMADYINNEIPQEKRSILVDQNFSYGVMITSGRPQNFLDRADEGEDEWQGTIDNPFGKVSYLLITTSRAGDQIAKKWPTAVEGGEAGMTPVFRTDRYVLVEVSSTAPPQRERSGSPSTPRTSPNPVTPSSPINPNGPQITTPSAGRVDTTPTSPVKPSGNTVEPNNGSSSAPSLEGE